MSTTSLEQRSDLTALGSTRFSRLLLVDDNVSLLITLTQIIEDEGFTVVGCATAEEALLRSTMNVGSYANYGSGKIEARQGPVRRHGDRVRPACGRHRSHHHRRGVRFGRQPQ